MPLQPATGDIWTIQTICSRSRIKRTLFFVSIKTSLKRFLLYVDTGYRIRHLPMKTTIIVHEGRLHKRLQYLSISLSVRVDTILSGTFFVNIIVREGRLHKWLQYLSISLSVRVDCITIHGYGIHQYSPT